MCQGTGIVRSVESVALDVLRSLEDRLITDGVMPLVATTAVDVALYILNQKRAHLKDIELRYRIPITVTADEEMHVSQFAIERSAETAFSLGEGAVVHMDWAHHTPVAETPAEPAATPATAAETEGEQSRRRSRRRRRKRRGPGDHAHEGQAAPRHDLRATHDMHATDAEHVHEEAEDEARPETQAEESTPREGGGQEQRRPRRRGRRGGRRGRSGGGRERAPGETASAGENHADSDRSETSHHHAESSRGRSDDAGSQNGSNPRDRETTEEPKSSEPKHAPRREPAPAFSSEPRIIERSVGGEGRTEDEAAPPRRGWWSR
jgi:ribonuclease E